MGKSKIAGGAGNRVSDSIEAYFYSDGERIPPDTLVGIENKSTSSLRSTGVLIDNTSTYKGGYTYVKTEDIDEKHLFCAFIKGIDDSDYATGRATAVVLDISGNMPKVISVSDLTAASDMGLCRLSINRFAVIAGYTGGIANGCNIYILDIASGYQIRQMSVTQVSAYHRPFIFAYKQDTLFFSCRPNSYGAATYVYAVDDAGNLTLKSTYDGSFYSFADVGNGTLLGAPENSPPAVSVLHVKDYTISLGKTLNLCSYPHGGYGFTTLHPVLQGSVNKFYMAISGSGKGRYFLSYADNELTVLNHVDAHSYSDSYSTDVLELIDLLPKLGLITYNGRLALLDYTALAGLSYTDTQVFDVGGAGLSKKCTDMRLLKDNTALILFNDSKRRLCYSLVELDITSIVKKGYCTVDGVTKQTCNSTRRGKVKIFT